MAFTDFSDKDLYKPFEALSMLEDPAIKFKLFEEIIVLLLTEPIRDCNCNLSGIFSAHYSYGNQALGFGAVVE